MGIQTDQANLRWQPLEGAILEQLSAGNREPMTSAELCLNVEVFTAALSIVRYTHDDDWVSVADRLIARALRRLRGRKAVQLCGKRGWAVTNA